MPSPDPHLPAPRSALIRAAPWVLGLVIAVLALGLALLGFLNRRSVERAAGQAYDGRALDIGLSTAAALWMLKPRGRSELDTAIQGLAEGPVISLAVINARGVVMGSSRVGERGSRLPGSRHLKQLQRDGAFHSLERVAGGDRPRYRVWILLRPGIRRFGRGGRHSRWRRHGPGEARGFGPEGPTPLGRAVLRLEVEISDPPIAAAVSRAREVQVVALAASAVLLLLAGLGFVGERWAVRLRQRVSEQRRLAEMGEMAAVLAHEIRNPLGVIKGYAQLLREKAPAEEGVTLDRVVSETGRLERLVNGLLDYARPAPLQRQDVALEELATRACELAADEATRRGVRFVFDLPALRSAVDPDQVLQVLLNLVRNAVQASPSGATVTVRGRRQAGAAVLEVVDSGEGLPAELGEDIFKPFVTTRAEGTGLGLALSRQIARAHGGTLTARPGVDRGTIFTLRLPLRPPPASPGAS